MGKQKDEKYRKEVKTHREQLQKLSHTFNYNPRRKSER